MPKGWTRPVLTSDNPKLKLWRATVNVAAQSAMRVQGQDRAEKPTPLTMHIAFYFARPKSVKHTLAKTTKPDIDKLIRSVLDSLTAVVYEDDSQVVTISASKLYGTPERVEILAASL